MTAAAVVHDPETGQFAPCPCHRRAADGYAGWHLRKGPAPLLATLHGHDVRSWRPDWVDHSYRLHRPNGSWCWVAEPYSLGPDAFADFAYLEQHGFWVGVTTWKARHYPGHTLAVSITTTEER
jgi:hypothetical protein